MKEITIGLTSRVFILLFLLWSRTGVNAGADTLPESVVLSITDEVNSAIIAEITDYGGVDVKTDIIQVGGSAALPAWTAKVSFGYDRHVVNEYDMRSSGSLNDKLQYDQHTENTNDIFAQFVWVPNNDEFIEEVFHKVAVVKFFFGSIENIDNLQTDGTVGDCSYTVASSSYTSTGYPYLVVVQFAIHRFFEPSDISHSNAEFKMTGSKRAVLGSLLFSKSSAVMTVSELSAVMSQVTPLVCAELKNTEYICCQGDASGGDNKPLMCTCEVDKHGDCCDRECHEGSVETLPPNDSEVCICDVEWGGPQCDNPFASHHFISKQQYPRDLCQDLITNRINYLYSSDAENVIEEAISSAIQSNKVFFGMEGSLTQVTYDQAFSTPLNGISDTTRDFLFSASIDKPDTLTGTIELKVEQLFLVEEDVKRFEIDSEMADNQACRYSVTVIRRYGDSTTETAIELFIVAGQLGYSSMWDDVTAEPGNLVTDTTTSTFKVAGTDMTGLVIGYMFSGRMGSGDIPTNDLTALMDCFIDNACKSLEQFECSSGTIDIVDDIPVCRCNAGFVGPACDLPLC